MNSVLLLPPTPSSTPFFFSDSDASLTHDHLFHQKCVEEMRGCATNEDVK